MKREAMGEGMSVMKKDHWEKDMSHTKTSDLKYSKSENGNPEELTQSVNALSDYVKKNRVKY